MSNRLGRRARRNTTKGPLYIQMFRYVLNCPAYISLSQAARAALIEVNNAYNGANNGKIVLSERQLAERMSCDRKTVRRALHELIEKGFIEPRIKGAFSVKFRRATEWRLNDRRCDVTGEQMSQAFLKWQGPAKNGQPKLKSRE
jgi:DNA-binding transcriptional regulator YhcF (GntR family)